MKRAFKKMKFDDDNIYDNGVYDNRDDDDEEESEEEDYVDIQVNIVASDANDRCKKYTVLSLNDISERQRNAIATVCSVLSVSEVEAGILLRHFSWDISNVYDKWFANEEKVRNAVGLLSQPNVNLKEEEKREELISCPICFDDYKMGNMREVQYCGHRFCEECWRRYIHTSINNDGPGCLNLRCPNVDPRCRAVVGEDLVVSLGLSEEDASKYRTYVVRSYVEQNSRVKWCPAPGCEYAVQIGVVDVDASCREVVCDCSHKFCWKCLEEWHRPIDCDTVKKWVSMINEGESRNLYWIIGNSKPCPKCKRPIQKNQGCMRMRCLPPCGFEFCWICLRDWNVHGYDTSVACNQYRPPETSEGDNSQSLSEDMIKMAVKMSSDRLLFYLERWKANDKSQEKAFSDLQRVRVAELKELGDSRVLSQSISGMTRFKYVVDAWLQIVECRRMLKWTYAYGHYLPLLLGNDNDVKQKQNFFEFLQGDAENSLERLHQCAEHELQQQMERVRKAEADIQNSDTHSTKRDFDFFYKKLLGLTKATAAHFERLIKAFENGLEEVHSQ